MTNEIEISADVVQTVLGDHWQIIGQLGERKPKIVNTCSCGIKYTLSQFRTLPMVGIQEMTDGELPAAYEMRNCTCGSTRSIGLDGEGEPWKEESND